MHTRPAGIARGHFSGALAHRLGQHPAQSSRNAAGRIAAPGSRQQRVGESGCQQWAKLGQWTAPVEHLEHPAQSRIGEYRRGTGVFLFGR